MSRLLFERFLSRFPRVKILELLVPSGGSSNLLGADQWETFLHDRCKYLMKFDFDFQLAHLDHLNDLSTFRNPFWINENRRWYVFLHRDDRILSTIPRFSYRLFRYSFPSILSSITTTIPSTEYFSLFEKITEFEWTPEFYPLKIINELQLVHLHNLKIKSEKISSKQIISVLASNMPNVTQLSVDAHLIFNSKSPCHQIISFQGGNVNLVSLAKLFPEIQILTIHLSNLKEIVQILKKFQQIFSLSVHLPPSVLHWSPDQDPCQYMIQICPPLMLVTNFTCRIDHQPTATAIHLWIHQTRNISRKNDLSYSCLLV